jgi:hypothetical protein
VAREHALQLVCGPGRGFLLGDGAEHILHFYKARSESTVAAAG